MYTQLQLSKQTLSLQTKTLLRLHSSLRLFCELKKSAPGQKAAACSGCSELVAWPANFSHADSEFWAKISARGLIIHGALRMLKQKMSFTPYAYDVSGGRVWKGNFATGLANN
jgi:hypothetical protein